MVPENTHTHYSPQGVRLEISTGRRVSKSPNAQTNVWAKTGISRGKGYGYFLEQNIDQCSINHGLSLLLGLVNLSEFFVRFSGFPTSKKVLLNSIWKQFKWHIHFEDVITIFFLVDHVKLFFYHYSTYSFTVTEKPFLGSVN